MPWGVPVRRAWAGRDLALVEDSANMPSSAAACSSAAGPSWAETGNESAQVAMRADRIRLLPHNAVIGETEVFMIARKLRKLRDLIQDSASTIQASRVALAPGWDSGFGRPARF